MIYIDKYINILYDIRTWIQTLGRIKCRMYFIRLVRSLGRSENDNDACQLEYRGSKLADFHHK